MANVTLAELKRRLKPKQLLAAELLVANEFETKESRRTYEAIAEEVGITARCLYEWRQDPDFIRYSAAVSDTRLDSYRALADAQLIKLISGTSNNGLASVRGLELFYKLNGKLVEKREVVTHDKAAGQRLNDDDLRKGIEELNEMLD
ncbi:phBC6A51 family helix-turn-helix protein [Sporosarcina newyorkensis]|uniref:Helix-turn-helix of insertion element transposase n=1 Tax=Sporosarcina newyorkensis TaxID=759851 RepID=A0A1T4XH76_9BACL|nr:phBC6A51 family helix-turn-helix protein [Sporosarcina newyorkensis]SKA88777.1 Helix-turn-helix of insertion element transposase [Sporosarcina newyorkensis]